MNSNVIDGNLNWANYTEGRTSTTNGEIFREEEEFEMEEDNENELLNSDEIKVDMEYMNGTADEEFAVMYNNDMIKEEPETDTLNEQLNNWYDKNCPSREGFVELMSILREEILRQVNAMYPEEKSMGASSQHYVYSENGNCHPYEGQNDHCCSNQYEARIQQITETVADLKNTIEKLEATIVTQNKIIVDALTNQKVISEKILGKQIHTANMRDNFPIKTIVELEQINKKINESNSLDYVRCLSSLLKGQLHKSVREIFSVDVIVASNVDGIHGKLSLKQFKQLYEVLTDAIYHLGEQDPEKALRNAFKLIKKRHFQSVCMQRKKNNENTSNTNLNDENITVMSLPAKTN